MAVSYGVSLYVSWRNVLAGWICVLSACVCWVGVFAGKLFLLIKYVYWLSLFVGYGSFWVVVSVGRGFLGWCVCRVGLHIR
jgi:hypothetical protein